MSKSQGNLRTCPNPNCSSKVHKVFLSVANLNKHFATKPACYEFARQCVDLLVKESALVEQKMLSFSTEATTNNQATLQNVAEDQEMVLEETEQELNEPDNNFLVADYEDDGFYHPELDYMDNHGYTTTYTKEQIFLMVLYCNVYSIGSSVVCF
jgi:hypothetical protein